MKKKSVIFMLLLLALCIEKSKAQTSYIGIKSGVNIPTVYFTDFLIDTRMRSGFFTANYYAVTYRYMHQPKIGVQIDLAYSTKGWQQNTLFLTNSFRNEINYMEMPVYLHWDVIGNRKFKFHIDLGMYVAYAISAQRSVRTLDDLGENKILYNIETDNRGDFGLTVGAGFSYNFPFGIIQIEGNFKSGFANILPTNHITKENPAVSTNQVPAVLLSYLFPLSKN